MAVNWTRAIALVALTMACQGRGDDTDLAGDAQVSFPTPWEGATASSKRAKGSFLAQVGHEYPGTGWFDAGSTVGRDVVQVNIIDPGSSWPVVQIRILGYSPEGWNELEIDVALNKFVAGSIAFDGDSATGRVLDASSGEVRYLLEGELLITQPGIELGQTVEGEFKRVTLSEAM